MLAPNWRREAEDFRTANLIAGTAVRSRGAREDRHATFWQLTGNQLPSRSLPHLDAVGRPFLPSSLALGIHSHSQHAKEPSYRAPQSAHRGLNLCAMTSPVRPTAAVTTPRRPSRTPLSTILLSQSGAPLRSRRSECPRRTTPATATCPRCLRPSPALPPGPSQHAPSYGYPQPMAQPVPMQHAPAPYIPQQAAAPRGYPGPQQQPQRPVGGAGYEAMRPAAPRPAPYEDPYNRPYQGRGY